MRKHTPKEKVDDALDAIYEARKTQEGITAFKVEDLRKASFEHGQSEADKCLLEALEELVARARPQEFEKDFNYSLLAFEKARAAIARAKGEKP